MTAASCQLNYRCAAVQEASPAGLVVILYDLLVDDLRRAIAAMHHREIEERSKRLRHALLVLQILEGNLDMDRGGETARNLSAFYSHIRSQLLDAQFQSDPAPLERQIALLLDVRAAWQSVDAQPTVGVPLSSLAHSTASAADSDGPATKAVASWSA